MCSSDLFDPETRITIDTVSQQLQKLDPEARVLHTRVDQGDLLIWNGRRSFLDSRVLPFSSAQYPVFEQHDNVRRSLLRPPQSTESADPKEKERLQQDQQKNIAAAKETLTQYGVTHFMIRLAPPGTPDYESMLTLTSSGEFVPVSIEASAALLEKVSGQAAPETVAAKMPNFVQMAFVDAKQDMKEVRIFARPQGFYERYIYRNRPVMSAERRQAQHYMALANPNPKMIEWCWNHISTSLKASKSDKACDFLHTIGILEKCNTRVTPVLMEKIVQHVGEIHVEETDRMRLSWIFNSFGVNDDFCLEFL